MSPKFPPFALAGSSVIVIVAPVPGVKVKLELVEEPPLSTAVTFKALALIFETNNLERLNNQK